MGEPSPLTYRAAVRSPAASGGGPLPFAAARWVTVLLVGGVLCSPLLAAPPSEPGGPPAGPEPSGPYRLLLAFEGTPALDRPATLVLKAFPLASLAGVESTEAGIKLPDGVKLVSGRLDARWTKPPRPGVGYVLKARVLVSRRVAGAPDPFIAATVTTRRGATTTTADATLYLLVLSGRLQVVDSLSISVRQSARGIRAVGEPFDVVVEATAPVDLPCVRYTIGLPEGVALVRGDLEGEVALHKGQRKQIPITVRVEKAGRWVVGSFFEGWAGTHLFRGSGDLPLHASPDGSLVVPARVQRIES